MKTDPCDSCGGGYWREREPAAWAYVRHEGECEAGSWKAGLEDRIELACEWLIREEEERFARYGFGLSDDSILDATDNFALVLSVDEDGPHYDRADYDALQSALWERIEAGNPFNL